MADRRLGPQEWMRDTAVTAVLDALRNAGGTPRFVGGCVRDAILGLPAGDIDIAVDLTPTAVEPALTSAGLGAAPTGIDHGTITAISEGRAFEVTSLRRDVETDGRHAVVTFTTDWRDDSLRRDFTVNALYADPDGTVLDFHGGWEDLQNRRLRFVGDADRRIQEDVLRILRFFRFHAQLAIPDFDENGLAACRRHQGRLPDLSAERVAAELRKLLLAQTPAPTIRRMIDGGFLTHWLPEATSPDALHRLTMEEAGRGEADAIRRMAALCTGRTRDIAGRLKLSNSDAGRLHLMADDAEAPTDGHAQRTLVYRLGAAGARDLALVRMAYEGPVWQGLLHTADTWPPPTFPLRGADVLAIGIEPGPTVGDILSRVEKTWIAGDFSETRSDLLARLTREECP